LIPDTQTSAARPSLAGDADRARRELWEARLRKEAYDEAHGLRVESFFGLRGLILLGLKAAGLYGRGVRNACSPVLREVEFRFANLPARFDGYRILHLTDFHFAGRPAFVEGVRKALDPVRADLCLMTGDYRFECYGPVDDAVRSMEQLLPSIHARRGIYASLGNHDPAALVEPYRALGIRWLINDNARIDEGEDSIWLVGLDDNRFFRTHSLPVALSGVPEGAFTVLLAHSPELGPQAARADIDLYLCGHTHAGQIRFPVIGAVRSNDPSPRRRIWGPWREGDLQGCTSAGVGTTSLPVRFNCPPEAVLVRLRRAE
jgi:predicted MPP superfamily phosphohydrolase